MTYVLTGIGGFISLWIVQNSKLKDGVTELFLAMLGKFGSKKIPLKSHKAFITIKNYENQLNLFLFNSHTKSQFYKEFMTIIFRNLNIMANHIVDSYNSENFDAEYMITEQIENFRKKIDLEVITKLVVPTKIEKQIEHWKFLMIASLKTSIISLINDDINDSSYFKIYRTLDTFLSFTNFITGTGSILFNNINGAFDELELDDLYKKNIEIS